MGNHITRRGIMGAALAVPALAVNVPAMATATISEAEAAFERWKAGRIWYCAADLDDAQDKAFWARNDADEQVIMDSAGASTRLAVIRLWLSLNYHRSQDADCHAILREDLRYFLAKGDDLDWEERFIVQAIRALAGETQA